ncbi:biliverdin-producing heme oxygenase [Sphingomonas jaspsi]|uniref:biliverdin-producing heme oxygenase n=1 Tax=Sphingomonas jaspsi TaxID=392409 RepID=UPI0004AD3B95|nr:biliverdin-producing heme oxygenase [Sphingomonas jaspsi]
MSARAYLRALTRDAHDRVDALFTDHDLSNPDHYRRFLTVQAAAYLPIEAALDAAGVHRLIDDWAERRRGDLLRADLANLGMDVPEPVLPPRLADDAAIAGAAYVLEGSRLGGALLKRQLLPDVPQQFLNAPAAHGAWAQFVAAVERILYSDVRQESAGKAAIATFACFEEAARSRV